MIKLKLARYLSYFGLLSILLATLLGSSFVFASQESGNSLLPLPPDENQLDQEEEIKIGCMYPMLEAESGSVFEFECTLSYQGSGPKTFALNVTVPSGWLAAITPTYEEKRVSAIQLEPGEEFPDRVKVLVAPGQGMLPEPGEYTVLLEASSGNLRDSSLQDRRR